MAQSYRGYFEFSKNIENIFYPDSGLIS